MKLSPALAYLASNPWAMEFGLFARMSEILEAHAQGERADPETVAALTAAASAAPAKPGEAGMEWIGRTAVIPMRGVVARYASSVNGICQPQGRSAEAIQNDLMAAASRGADRIILRIDSPGGEVAGTAETAAMVRHIGATIPVVAYVDGLAASAAYWIASQASEIIASSDTAQVGSIGVASVIRSAGGGQTVITSAPAKSSPGLNDAQLANARAIVVDLATAFADSVAAGRGMTAEQAAAIATGEVWTAQRALGLRLIDKVATWEQVIGNTADAQPAGDAARRQAIAARLNSTVTVSAPNSATNPGAQQAGGTVAAGPDALNPAVAPKAQANDEESPVDTKLMATLAALCQTHATIAAELVSEANKAGATAEGLTAFAGTKALAAKDAENADLKAKLAAATKRADDEKARADKAQADHDRLAALAKGAPQDPGPSSPESAKATEVARSEYDKNPSAYANDLRLGKVRLVDG